MPTSPFDRQRFLVLETFRKNGTSVITPLGFVQESSVIYARTTADSWKVKRIRANPRVRVAPGTGSGKPLGDWIEATATILPGAESAEVRAKILAKYPLIWRLIETVDGLRNCLRRQPQPEWVHLRIDLKQPS
ncbi:MAG: PPOX class F420-dependent oxidoreductase [Anaerolineae bacterium]|nr:PPOX class F420-dependent oxidoreductase [Anaerolineae bacterium]